MLLIFFIILVNLPLFISYEYGDRLASLVQSSHKEWRSPWMDIPIQNMPRFRVPDSSILRVHLPYEEKDGTYREVMIDLQEDVMVSLTFAANKLVIPKFSLFDAKERKSIEKLTITFSHDQYDVLSIDYKYKYGSRLKRIDPLHPSLTALEITYHWESVQEDDFPFAITMMFGSSVIVMIGIAFMLWSFVPKDRSLLKYQATRPSMPSLRPLGAPKAFDPVYDQRTGR